MDSTCKKCGHSLETKAKAQRQLQYKQCRQVFRLQLDSATCPHCGAGVKVAKKAGRDLQLFGFDSERTTGSSRGFLGVIILTFLLSAGMYRLLTEGSDAGSANAAEELTAAANSESAAMTAPVADAPMVQQVALHSPSSVAADAPHKHHNTPELKGLDAQNPDAWMDFIDQHLNIKETKSTLVPKGARVSSGFGYRVDPFVKTWRFHHGLDISMKRGTPVKALLPGKVVFAGYAQDYGRVIFVEHPHGLTTVYGHLQRIDVVEGQMVDRKQLVGAVGSSGRSTGPHLHFEVRLRNKRVDPASIKQFQFLSKAKSAKRRSPKLG